MKPNRDSTLFRDRNLPRQHALDNLRALMMWLGIVLHVAAMHTAGPSPLTWHDRATSPVADLLMAFIHAFRMPVFFIVAGYFVALLVQQRGPDGMLRHRFRRIALPFLLFWPPLLVATMTLALVYAYNASLGGIGIDITLVSPPPGKPLLNTMHLWFIYLLWWLAIVAAGVFALVRRLPAVWRAAVSQCLQRLGGAWWGVPLLCLPLVLAGAGHLNGITVPSGSLLPHWSEWLHNGMFFFAGTVLFTGRETLLPLYARRAGVCFAAGLPFFIAALVLVGLKQHGNAVPHSDAWTAFAYNAATWWWSAAVLGLFVRHLSGYRPLLAYLSHSAYWVYLVHLPLTVAFGALLYHTALGALPKMLLNIALTTAVCLLSYQVLVRGRWIGRLLNGAATPADPPAPQAEVLPTLRA